MFTGLIQDIGTLASVSRPAAGATARVVVSTALPAESFELGESIALDGACHTVVARRGGQFEVDSSPETQKRTTFDDWAVGARVHLERALALGDRLGGHLVQGHVDEVARLIERREAGGSLVLIFSLPETLAPLVVEKGSLAIDGVSLTVNGVGSGTFTVTLIPETRRRTRLGEKRVGARVNLEADLLGRYVQRLLQCGRSDAPAEPGLDLDRLRAAGFA